MATRLPVLQNIGVATPCPAKWDDMKGDDRKRFCEQCSLHVYNFAELTDEQAVRLLTESEGPVCGRLYRRADGTIITRNCPVGVQILRKKLAWTVGRVAAALVVVGGLVGLFRTVSASTDRDDRLTQIEPFTTIQRWLDPVSNAPVMMGDIISAPPMAAWAGRGAARSSSREN